MKMKRSHIAKKIRSILPFIISVVLLVCAGTAFSAVDVSSPETPVKLIFIHHSTGENWLADDNGGLGLALMNNNYYVSDTYYGWNNGFGDNTDIGHWWNWFRGEEKDTVLSALFNESGQISSYSRLSEDPGGENRIAMFKSCFPNSALGGSPDDQATTGENPLRGEDAWSDYMTVGNAKGIYNDILEYFKSKPDTLFIAVTAPPLGAFETDAEHARNARAFNNWLVYDWLKGYNGNNVKVFDFYNILTSNGGNSSVNDLHMVSGNHHRIYNSEIQHIQTYDDNVSAYPSDEWDSHPSQAGNLKATGEFIGLLNTWYHEWRSDSSDESQMLETPAAPDFSIDINGTAVTFSWSSVENADYYVFYYISFPEPYLSGNLHVQTTAVPVSLWSGAGFAAAVKAVNKNGESGFSNVEAFVLP